MKKQLLLFSSLIIIGTEIKAQSIVDTVSTDVGYANQKWYSLQNDEQGTAQSKDNWDLAFELTGFNASILANTQKSGFAVYHSPYSINQWAILDTTGIKTWTTLYNSDTTWTIGAFNKGIDAGNMNDLGWGIYDMNTHFVNGDSCYVIKLSATSYKKIKFDNLGNGVYNFTYSNIDGTNQQIGSVTKSNFTGKNFVYYDLTNNTTVDREPLKANWDLTFVKYTTFIPSPYPVTGVLSNKGVTVAQVDNIADVSTYNSYQTKTFSTVINEIGYDWKSYDFGSNSYIITDSSLYFVKTAAGNVWKVIFKGFGGTTSGNFIFSKELLTTTGITDQQGNAISQFSVYPNPTTDDNLTILFSSDKKSDNASIKIVDITGNVITSENINLTADFNKYDKSLTRLSNGVYFIQITSSGHQATQKFIKQ